MRYMIHIIGLLLKMHNILNKSFSANKPLIISGPCVVEGRDLCLQVAEQMKSICEKSFVGRVEIFFHNFTRPVFMIL